MHIYRELHLLSKTRIFIGLFIALSIIGTGYTYAEGPVSGSAVSVLTELLKRHSSNLKTNNSPGQAQTYSQIAAFYERNGIWRESVRLYKEALSIQDQLKDIKHAAGSSIHLAYILKKNDDYSAALKHAASAARLYSKAGIKDSSASAYVLMADINRALGNYRQAESLILKRALPLYRGAGNATGRIKCFRSLGHTYREQKRFSEAKWFFIQENMQARKLNNSKGIISSLLYLGKVKVAITDYDLALKDFKEAERLARNTGNISALADIRSAFASVHSKLGNAETSARFASLASGNRYQMLALEKNRRDEALLLFKESQNLVELSKRSVKPDVIDAVEKTSHIRVWDVYDSLLITLSFLVFTTAVFFFFAFARTRK
ncbi:soluble NSF attachment protein (SNAP)-like [Arcticibacter tournemirensis]|uniref:tetratricopeptide repeat protein n=1 Tax=Arcticibacter tournemirensis TaxID=699437 RepID=UPI001170820E|nr:tetratricopeptide repeat protein [Arcticibacter tournemirensis]TQM52661.1 soluble NSF attachment protein (SNAP)-like [Arcticibacter tournemirensis]